ncbi:30S ribosomal protein S18 [Candidatus Bathyarchaeota archaeon]|nr:30S ribosomal protein S18 [Candidatus Bathyarchaeota archaeon]
MADYRNHRREKVQKLKPEEIDYKRLDVLITFIGPTGKIEAARRTGASRKQQNLVQTAIKRARYLALMPYTRDDSR